MTNEIQYTIEWTIKNGGLDTFKGIANKVTGIVKDNEPGMKGYQWYFNDDETKCYTAEWLSSSESLLAHLQNVGEIIPELLKYSDMTRFEVFGNPSQEVLEVGKDFGAKVFKYYTGFTR